MKLKHLFFNALAVMAFAACSNEAEEIKPAEKASTATLQLDMTGQYGGGSSDQTRALSLDGTEYPRFIHEEGVTDWKTHCFIRNEAGTVQFYALVDWNATTDADENISLHIKNSKLTLQNSAGSDVTATETLPKAGERWYIAGMAGGGVLDATKSSVDFSQNLYIDQVLKSNQARVPLAFGWTPFTIPSNTERAPQIVVQFQPQGTLFSVYVNNKTNPLNGPLNTALVAETNAFSRRGNFDYSLTTTRAESTSTPKWIWWDEGMQTINVKEIRMEANTATNLYFWAMPRTSVSAEGFSTTLRLDDFTTYAEGTSTAPTAETKQYEAGKTYNMKTGLDVGPIIPVWSYLTPYNIAADGQSFNTTHSNRLVDNGYYTWSEAVEKFSKITIDGVQYQLPSAAQWRIVVPSWYNGATSDGFIRFNLATAVDNRKEYVSGSGNPKEFLSSYRGSLNNESYALRFWTETGDYSQLTAVRYQYVDNPLGLGKIMKVTFRYLGPTASATTADEIANTAYWESNTENDVTFDFPAAGYYYHDGSYMSQGATGCYWASSTGSSGSVQNWRMVFNATDAQVGATPLNHKHCIRLFKVKP